MKRFRFTLQALLTLRQRAEQSALESYSVALSARQQALARLEAVREVQSQEWARRRSDLNQGCTAGVLVQWEVGELHLAEQGKAAEAVLGQTEIATSQALRRMVLARRDREAVEKFMRRQRLNHDRDLVREEQKALDELAQRRSNSPLNLAVTPTSAL